MSSETVPGRLNGFTRPFSPAQIAAWAALLCLSLEWLVIIAPILPVAAAVLMTLVYFGLVGLVLYYGGRTQAIDPMDPYLGNYLIQSSRLPTTTKLYEYFNPPTEYTQVADTVESQEVTLKHCWLCDTQVKPKSLHCKFCNKCCDEFDHHCMWLNTCIGKRNYQLFYRTMLALCGMLIAHFVVSIALVSASAGSDSATYLRMASWGNPNLAGDSVAAIRAILIFFIIFDLISLFLLGQLILFHVDLQRKGLSTYEFIVQDMERKRQASRREAELTSLRVREVNKAKRNGRNLYATRLVVGGYCRKNFRCASCDPLELPVKQEATHAAEQEFAMALGSDPIIDDQSDDEEAESEPENGVTFVKVDTDASRDPTSNGEDGQANGTALPGEKATTALADTPPAEQPARQSNFNNSSKDDDDAPSDEESLMNL